MKILSLNKEERRLNNLVRTRLEAKDYLTAEQTADLVLELLGDLLPAREVLYRLDCAYETKTEFDVLKVEDIVINCFGDKLTVAIRVNRACKLGVLFTTEKYTELEDMPPVSLNIYGKSDGIEKIVRLGMDGLVLSYSDEKINVYVLCYDMFKPIVERGKGYCIDTPNNRATFEFPKGLNKLTYSISEDYLLSMIKSVYPKAHQAYYLNVLKELKFDTFEFKTEEGTLVYCLMKSVIV